MCLQNDKRGDEEDDDESFERGVYVYEEKKDHE